MTVEMSRISKANICPYWGREIPGWEALGLTPDKSYKLFRDPKELEKAASTFDGKPLLIRHVAIKADLPNKSLWVGTLGACTFEAPYLVTRPLTVITREAQDLIEEDEQRELSAGYRYTAEMIPGVYGGEAYDGRMVNIHGNHVALVAKGRAGSDVLVADELPPELQQMKRGKLIKRLRTKFPSLDEAIGKLSNDELMALDAELGETPAKSVVKLTGDEEKAACDAALEEKRKTDGEDAELSDEEREAAMKKARDKKAKDAAKDEEPKEKGEDESEEEAEDEEEEPKPKAKDKGGRDKAKDADPDHRKDFNSIKQGKDKAKDKAMDSALAMDAAAVQKLVDKAVSRAQTATAEKVRAETRALAIAVDEVAPLVGKVQLHAFDSAEEVYGFALEKAGVEVEDDLPTTAYRALVKNEVKHRALARKPAAKSAHAMDSAAKGFDADTLFQRAG